MISKFNILKGNRVVNINTNKDSMILDYISYHDKIRIKMSKDTYEHKGLILRRIGTEYEKFISIIPNHELKFGEVIFEWFPYTDDDEFKLNMIASEIDVSTVELDKAIAIYSAEWLIMSNNTLSIIKNKACSCNDSSFNAFYHKYNNIPVALNEFLDPGEVVFISESKEIE